MFYNSEKEAEVRCSLSTFSDQMITYLNSGLSFLESLGQYFMDTGDYAKAYISFQEAEKEGNLSAASMDQMKYLKELRNEVISSPVYGKKYVITGDFYNYAPRKHILELINILGGTTSDNPVNDMDVLVAGHCEWSELNNGKPTRKIQKAKDLKEKGRHVEIISDREFMNSISDLCKKILSEELYNTLFL